MAAHERGENLIVVAVGFEFFDAILGCWPCDSRRGDVFLDSGFAVFTPEEPALLKWRELSLAVRRMMERHSRSRIKRAMAERSNGRRGGRMRQSWIEFYPDFTMGNQGAAIAQTLHFATIVQFKGERRGRSRGSKSNRKIKAFEHPRTNMGFASAKNTGRRGVITVAERRENAERRRKDQRLTLSLERMAIVLTERFLHECPVFTAAQKVAPPATSEWRQWSQKITADGDSEGVETGILNYAVFLRHQLDALALERTVKAAQAAPALGSKGSPDQKTGSEDSAASDVAERVARRI